MQRMREDMAERGWLATHLAKRAGLSDFTISLTLKGVRRNPATVAKMAKALGKSPRRYLIRTTAR